MKLKQNTLPFLVILHDNTEVTYNEESLDDLLEKHFPEKKKRLEKVKAIIWKTKSTFCRYRPETGMIEKQISDGDINPYGWRMDHS